METMSNQGGAMPGFGVRPPWGMWGAGDLLRAIESVTGTPCTIENTGGGTLTGVVSFVADDDVYAGPHAYFGIVHEPDTGVESAGCLSLMLWPETATEFCLSQHDIADGDLPWVAGLEQSWRLSRDDLGQNEFWCMTYDAVVEWFRREWANTVRVVDENRRDWETEESRQVWTGRLGR